MTSGAEVKNAAGSNYPTRKEATSEFLKIGILSFGGPAAQISLMHRVFVEEKRWLSEHQFLNALSFCMLLPGPEAMQLATYTGWRLHGVPGGLIAGLLFVLPGALVIFGLASCYVFFGNLPLFGALFLGVKAAVLVIVIDALLRVAKKALTRWDHWVVAAFAFIGIFFLALPFPLILLLAAIYGLLLSSSGGSPRASSPSPNISAVQTVSTLLIWLAIWWFPIVLVDWIFDFRFLNEIGIFFSKLAVVTFGGAYAVLAYMGQQVVSGFGWLTPGEMIDGLGLAETTPGPLILVTEFVGFLAGFRQGGFGLAAAAAMLTLWATFTPCFLWIFTGAPYIDWICSQPKLSSALSAITAAVVGVILNLSVWFGLHVIFAEVKQLAFGPLVIWKPELLSVNWQVVVLSLLGAALLLKFRWSIVQVLLLSSLLGWVLVSIF